MVKVEEPQTQICAIYARTNISNEESWGIQSGWCLTQTRRHATGRTRDAAAQPASKARQALREAAPAPRMEIDVDQPGQV